MQRNFFFLQYKIRIGILLTVLIAAIIANNLWFSRNIKHMDRAANSIYSDRLMAATYISDLTHLLYKYKVEIQDISAYNKLGTDTMLTGLVKAYDGTMLTKQERMHWDAFKSNLHIQNNKIVVIPRENDVNSALLNLQELTKVQASEGSSLIQRIRQDIDSTSIGLFLEITIAIIIGLLVLTLLGLSKNTIVSNHRESALN